VLFITLTCLSQFAAAQLSVQPERVRLRGPESAVQLLVLQSPQAEIPIDQTRLAVYASADDKIATVNKSGRVEPRGEGITQVTVRVGDQQATVEVEVAKFDHPEPLSLANDVIPVLTKAGCNSGGCHGKAEGQNGFKLSIFGFDADADFQAIVQEARGRRINLAAPAHSLLLQKASSQIPHGGGRALPAESFGYRRVLRWISEGARPAVDRSAQITRIEVQPREASLALSKTHGSEEKATPGSNRQLRVIAFDAAGGSRDVTAEAAFETNAPTIAEVDERGHVQGSDVPGEAAILVRYMEQIAVVNIRTPRTDTTFVRPAEANFIDRLAWNKLQQMGIQPSALCDDATFLRRAISM